jgi:nicotinate-nucleotide pyrophosphorylase
MAEVALADAQRALQEDVGDGVLTTSLVAAGARATARVLLREPAVLCGTPWVEAVVRQLDPQARVLWHGAEGAHCAADQMVLKISGGVTLDSLRALAETGVGRISVGHMPTKRWQTLRPFRRSSA